jgi:malate dehydrogenase
VRLDHNRAIAQVAKKTGSQVADVTNMTIWGNHSATQYPDLFNAKVKGSNAAEAIADQSWIENDFLPTVQKRGAAIIEARGASSAASAANAAIDHIHDWVLGTPEGDWVSMAIPSNDSYGIGEGVFAGYPCTCSGGEYTVVEGLSVGEFSRGRIDATVAELRDEAEAVKGLGLIYPVCGSVDNRRRRSRVPGEVLVGRVPALAVAPYLAVLHEVWHDSIQVVGLRAQ